MEKQARDLYNKAIFVKFQQQLRNTTALQIEEIEKDKVYEVFVDQNQPEQPYRLRRYVVVIDLQRKEYTCLCGKFNKDGILCSHILKVMIFLNARDIPEKYILDRWRRNEKKSQKDIPAMRSAENSTLRFNSLSRRFVKVVSKG